MLLNVFERIAEEHPALAGQVGKLERLLSQRGLNVPIRPSRDCDFIDADEEQLRWLMAKLPSELIGVTSYAICEKCDAALEGSEDPEDPIDCDLCGNRYRTEALSWEEGFYLKIAVVVSSGGVKRPRKGRRKQVNTLSNVEMQKHARIIPWRTLEEHDYVKSIRTLGPNEHADILTRLERFGLCLLRWEAEPPTHERIESFNQWIGPICNEQNAFTGKVKSIEPRENVKADTGDSRLALSPHVDGTQHESTPALLVFQYEFGPTWGGQSTFIDMAAMLGELPADRLEYIVRTLSRSDAASCKKDGVKREFRGPLITPVCGQQSVAVRIRLDEVMQASKDCQAALEELRGAIRAWHHNVTYMPQEGDIVIFDNWRLLHGREAVGGRHKRVHDRMWIERLLAKHDGFRLLGVRPIGHELMHAIALGNNG